MQNLMKQFGVFNVQIVQDTAEPQKIIVKFYDTRYKNDNDWIHGQFVSSYYAKTLLEDQEQLMQHNFSLDGGIPAWTVPSEDMRNIFSWLKPRIDTLSLSAKIQWGLNPMPEVAGAIWGARGILQNETLELLHDRQSFDCLPDYEDYKSDFIGWINRRALPHLQKHIRTHHWAGSTADTFGYSEGSYHCQASPNASYGYCYITCWLQE